MSFTEKLLNALLSFNMALLLKLNVRSEFRESKWDTFWFFVLVCGQPRTGAGIRDSFIGLSAILLPAPDAVRITPSD